jgi:hypothetical protein
MRRTILTILGTLLITVSAVQMCTASERHARKGHDRWLYRSSYNQARGPSYGAPLTNGEKRNLEDFGWTGRDPSRVGGRFPYFNGGTGD